MPEQLIYADRSERAKLRAWGPQSAWFLDQMLTQSFQDMEVGEARDAALITVHGRMTGYLEAIRTAESFLLHLEPGLGAPVQSTLERYVLSTRVQIQDITEEMGLVLVVGQQWRDAAPAVAAVARQPTSSLGEDAGYIWIARAETAAVLRSLAGSGARLAGEDELEAIRIENGVPRWGRDMDEKTFPQEAGIDLRAVHYAKGCYLGQEAMAKIHFRGKVNRRLVRLRAAAPLVPGSEVSLEGAAVGRITSASDSCALAMIRHSVAEGESVTVGDVAAEVLA